MQKITPFLWFNGNAEEAITFYVSIFHDGEIIGVSRFGDNGPGPAGAVMTGTLKLGGQEFMVLNGGPEYKFTEAVSFFVSCDDQEEVDNLWGKLAEGGQESRCGWLKDKFGLSWQIIPRQLGEMLQDEDPEKASRVMAAMLTMGKIDIKALRQAYDGVTPAN